MTNEWRRGETTKMKVSLQKIYWEEILNILKVARKFVSFYSGQENLVDNLNTIITEIERVLKQEESNPNHEEGV